MGAMSTFRVDAMTRRMPRWILLAVALAATPGCSGTDGPQGSASSDAGAHPAARTYAPTYDAIWNEIFLDNCLLCHSTTVDYLTLPSEAAGYRALVGTRAQGPDCAQTGLLRVEPYHPEKSLLYLKVTTPPCGDKMPLLPGNPSLDPRDVAQIRRWIECGALDGDSGCPEDAGNGLQDSNASHGAT
jgi:hypothetical protein